MTSKASFHRQAIDLGLVLCFSFFFTASGLAQQDDRFDVLIRGGRIVDGAGNPWFRGDVAIRGDRIVAMGHLPRAMAKRTIDAAGQIVAPGFIDMHNHSRREMFEVPNGENYIRQGATTIIEGNDGSSPLPLKPFFEKIEQSKLAINCGSFIGHGSIRREVIGSVDRKATPQEMDQMRRLVKQGMEQGALGISSGLFYIPGAFAPTEELIELSKVAAEYGGIYISHMRDEAAGLLESVRETIEIGEKGGLPTQMTHHKAIGAANWGRSLDSLKRVEEARARGVDVSIDQYPYTASYTGTAALFPQWAQEGGREKLLARLKDPATRARIKADIAERIKLDRGGGDPKNVQLSLCDWDPGLDGKTLADVTRDRGREVTFENAAETAMEIQQAGGCKAVYHAMQEQDVERIMQYPGTMIASDGGILIFGKGVPHPRNYGTFPRVLGRYVREKRILRLEDAVRKMTSLPAQRVGLFDRGLLRPGMKADIAIFDPDKVIDRAQFGKPHQYAEGVSYVLVNGVLVLDNGKMTDARPGAVLYGAGRKANSQVDGPEV
ncbi:D-aminoacylase [Acidobacteria bacterium AH-259-O06]|nr:D-aminoacylase [Acidobacteria bacterium AH-259-O06]